MTARTLSLLSRRGLLVGAAAAMGAAMASPVLALDVASARELIDRAVGEVNKIINSGRSEAQMYSSFEALFVKYADVQVIARSALGPAARTASAGEMQAFTKAYQGYIARKYGSRFREFIGGRIEVMDAKPIKTYFEVISVAYLQGESPFDLRWHVAEKGGRRLFFNIIIEGVNMLATERAEIGAMLDKRRGNVAQLIEDLKRA